MTIEQAKVLAEAAKKVAKKVAEEHRIEIDLTGETVEVHESWAYTIPEEYQERREDPWLR